ncbi:beta strand repeat-containing protein [Cellulophaga sp. Asnod2-G02]|uniref:beta strand repeat-containing protein n=1 Tax=Cellulophaga sp. Asnod2-G02 TaxID=3160572 RepID=UPI00386AC0FE
MKTTTKYILASIALLALIIACTKEVGLYTEVEFEITEEHEVDGFISTPLATFLTITPEELLEDLSYSFSYKINSGAGYFEAVDGSIIQEGEKASFNPLSASLDYIPTAIGDHSVTFTASDTFGFTEEITLTYTITNIPVTWTAEGPTDPVLLGSSQSITVTLGNEASVTGATYQRSYSFSEGSGNLYTAAPESNTIAVNDFVSIEPGTYQLEYISNELGVTTIEFLLRDSNEQELIATVTFEVVDELSKEKEITSFMVNGVAGTITGTTIDVVLPEGTDLTALAPVIIHNGASISPESETNQDFSSPVIYTVTAQDETIQAYTVNCSSNVSVASVAITPNPITINIGGTENLSAVILPANATNQNVTWTSSDDAIASVSATGVVTGNATGSATITVTTEDGGFTATSTITVQAATFAVTGITVDPTAITITNGSTTTLTETIAPANASNQNVTWSSSDDAIASVSATGVVTGNATGSATITVTTEDGAFTATSTITVQAATFAVTGITVDPTSITIINGSSTTLNETIAPANATNQNVTWSSSDDAIASVSAAGVVTGNATGSATITVTTEDGGFTATSTITVQAATFAVTGITVDPTAITITNGSTTTLTETFTPANATNQNVTWSSSDDAIASVSATGVVTGNATGSATITVTTEDGGFTATSTITVQAATFVVTGITVDPTVITIANGSATTLTETITPANATNQNVTWTSSDDAIASVNAAGVVTGNATGSATITVTTEDGGFTATSLVTVEAAANEAPVANDFNYSAEQDSSNNSIDVSDEISDGDGDTLTVTIGSPLNGTAAISGTVITYSPTTGYSGNDQLNYTINDGNGGTDSGIISITVNLSAVNEVPVANDFNYSVEQDSSNNSIDVADEISDGDGDTLTVTIGSPLNGSAAISGTIVTYSPTTGYSGNDQITYTINDGNGGTDSGIISITVNPAAVNEVPVANDFNYSVEQDSSNNSIDVSDEISDGDGDTLTVTIGSPLNGTAAISGTVITYSPTTGYSGNDQITYTINDGNGGTDTGTISITVNPAAVNEVPIANNFNYSAEQDSNNNSIDVASEISDGDGDTLTVTIGSPLNGSAAISGTVITYSPTTGYSGNDQITYTINDGNGGTDSGIISITVNPAAVNEVPVANDFNYSVEQDSSNNSIDVSDEISDGDGDTLTVTIGSPLNGTAAISGTVITYSPTTGYSGNDQITYTINDGNGGTDTGTISITVNPAAVNEVPIANNFNYSAEQDSNNNSIDVASEISDGDGDTLTVTIGSPLNGSAAISGTVITYSPTTGYSGNDQITYTINDGNGGTDSGIISITVNPAAVNEVPVANDFNYSVEQDSSNNSIDVSDEISDGDGDTLTVTIGSPLNGTAAISGTVITYSPTTGYSGNDQIIYTINDGNGGTDTGTISITVNPAAVNEVPVANDFNYSVVGNSTNNTIDVASEISDGDGNPLTVTIGIPANGEATISGTLINYTPTIDFVGNDQLTYSVDDGNGGIDSGNITISVTAPDDSKEITAFTINGTNGTFSGTNITVRLPYGTEVTALTPSITYNGATIVPNTGVSQNFTNPITYTVTADDNTTQSYIVTVIVPSAYLDESTGELFAKQGTIINIQIYEGDVSGDGDSYVRATSTTGVTLGSTDVSWGSTATSSDPMVFTMPAAGVVYITAVTSSADTYYEATFNITAGNYNHYQSMTQDNTSFP